MALASWLISPAVLVNLASHLASADMDNLLSEKDIRLLQRLNRVAKLLEAGNGNASDP